MKVVPEIAELQRSFFNEGSDIFALYDRNLHLLDMNNAGLKLFRFAREDILGKSIIELSPDVVESGRYQQYQEVIRTGKPFVIDDLVPHPSLGSMHLFLKAFKVGEGLGLVATDITHMQEAVEELNTFMYKASHDLRGPLSTLIGLINLMEPEIKEPGLVHYFQMVSYQAERLDKIIHELIELTQIRQVQSRASLIDFPVVLEEVLYSLQKVEGFQYIAFRRDIELKSHFYTDRSLLVLVLQNLIENAVKYRKDNIDYPFIKIIAKEEGHLLVIQIEDNGIGIPEEFQNDVFKMFFRATDRSKGSGLGLYTVKQTIKKLDGSISLYSNPHQGSKFTIFLPNMLTSVME
ncbi:ATP-binding protein [Rapidithrix thailandica]|uniref:histidine kinase n=1 Tax=Rapidithrix thailandica TaxID=413964 RepID=A0AAW9RZB2_9BACT